MQLESIETQIATDIEGRFLEFVQILKTRNRKQYLCILDYIDNAENIFVLGANEFEFRDFLSSLDSRKLVYLNTIISDIVARLNIRYECGSEYAISVIINSFFYNDIKEEPILHLLHKSDLGNLIAESNISEMEMVQIQETLNHHKDTLFLIGPDFYLSDDYRKIAKVFAFFDCIEGVDVMPIPLPCLNLEKLFFEDEDSGEITKIEFGDNPVILDIKPILPPLFKDFETIILKDPELREGNGLMVYLANKIGKFKDIGNNTLFVSSQFLNATKLKEGNNNIKIDDIEMSVSIEIMESLSGVISVLISDNILSAKRYYNFSV